MSAASGAADRPQGHWRLLVPYRWVKEDSFGMGSDVPLASQVEGEVRPLQPENILYQLTVGEQVSMFVEPWLLSC